MEFSASCVVFWTGILVIEGIMERAIGIAERWDCRWHCVLQYQYGQHHYCRLAIIETFIGLRVYRFGTLYCGNLTSFFSYVISYDE